MTVARIGHGVRFLRSDGASPPTLEDLGELLEPAGPSLSRDAVEATHAQSEDRYREFISGLRDAGEATATIALDPNAGASTSHRKLLDDYNNDDAVAYRILFPNPEGTAFDFVGLITNLEHAMPIDDRMTLSLTIKISGKPTLSNTVTP
jgi:predicted secreted protein